MKEFKFKIGDVVVFKHVMQKVFAMVNGGIALMPEFAVVTDVGQRNRFQRPFQSP